MLKKEIRDLITDLIKREVVPAVGCTEPAAVSLAVARATELLGVLPENIELQLSGNILKNAMGVGIPGTGMIGLPIAVALGALIGRSEYGLEVLKDVNPDAVARGKKMICENRIRICHADNVPSNLYIRAIVNAEGLSAESIIAFGHTNFVFLRRDNDVLLDSLSNNSETSTDETTGVSLCLSDVWDYATTSPLDELEFILEAANLNTRAAHISINGEGKGHKVGKTISENTGSFGNSVVGQMLAMTSGACDTRMAGEPVAVMSNSGSGNQGIAITMPVAVFAREHNLSRETTVRALIMAHLTSIYIKSSLGRLSALCGCVVASTGASIALVYMMGGDFEKGSYAVKNMIATLTGMICDGAKPACSLKIASGVGTAYIAATMAINNHCVTSTEGIIDESVDATIRNFSAIGREAMQETDRMVLKIMSR